MAWIATAVVGAAAIGGAVKAYSASQAAGAQVDAAGRATQQAYGAAQEGLKYIQSYYDQGQSQLKPYQQLGQAGIDQLNAKLPGLTTPLPVSQEQLDLQKPLDINQQTLETLPGYQFALQQGLKATQNSAAARGLGTSGAALKGAANFTQGLADQNYNNYFQTEMANRQAASNRYQQVWQDNQTGQQTAYDRLMGIIGAGESAATAGASIASKAGDSTSKLIQGAGNTAAAATTNAGNAEAAGINAIGGAVSDAANNIGGFMAYKGLYGKTPGYVPSGGSAAP